MTAQPIEEISTDALLKELLSRKGGHEAMVKAVESGDVIEEVKNKSEEKETVNE